MNQVIPLGNKLLLETIKPMDHYFSSMTSEYIENNLIKPNSIEARDYQISLANQAKNQNSLVVLPTGLGKTTVALQVILDILSQKKGGKNFYLIKKKCSIDRSSRGGGCLFLFLFFQHHPDRKKQHDLIRWD